MPESESAAEHVGRRVIRPHPAGSACAFRAALHVGLRDRAQTFFIFQCAPLVAGTFFLPLIVFPLYLIVLLVRRPTPDPRPLRWKLIAPLVYGLLICGGVVLYLYDQAGRRCSSRASGTREASWRSR